MGNTSASGDDSKVPPYKRNARLAEELKAGANFLQRFRKVHFQFLGDLAEVWKVEDKVTKEVFSYHERQKDVLNQTSAYGTNVIKENYLLQRLNNPFIVRLKYACQDQRTLAMITSLIHSRLSFHIAKQQDFTEDQLRYIVASIVSGLDYLHNNQIMHRDLRPCNIVFDARGRVYISNFIMAREHESSIDNSIDNSGTVGYMAPEVIEKNSHEYEVDYYALGIILYEMATLKRLFDGTQEENLEKMKSLEIKRYDIPYKYSNEFVSLLGDLLKYNPRQRLGKNGAQDIMKHKWFVPFNWDALILGTLDSPFEVKEEEQESAHGLKLSTELVQSKRLSTQNLYLGYQYGFASPVNRLTRKREENNIV